MHSGEVGVAAAVGGVDGAEQCCSVSAELVRAIAVAAAGQEAGIGRGLEVAAAMECLAPVVDRSRWDTGTGEVEVEHTAERLDCVRAITSGLQIHVHLQLGC